MRYSVFSGTSEYIHENWKTLVSLFRSCWSSLPYLYRTQGLKKEITEQYPDPISSRTADELPNKTRGILFNQIDKCTGCGDCAVICPTEAISLELKWEVNRMKNYVGKFDIDFKKCIFCALCADVCPTQSLTHQKKFEFAQTDIHELVVHYGKNAGLEEWDE